VWVGWGESYAAAWGSKIYMLMPGDPRFIRCCLGIQDLYAEGMQVYSGVVLCFCNYVTGHD